jgi:hypothetical protein
MKNQNYRNYKMYYSPHHYIFLPLMVILMIYGAVNAFKDEPHRLVWVLFSMLSFCILYLAVMLRQHYALGNQDRIVRLEFRLRYIELMGKRSKDIENKISFSQIAALRFADDTEFVCLLEKALKENLSAGEIKSLVGNWQEDKMRV